MNTYDQRTDQEHKRTLETVYRGAIAGAAGGLAEMAWITLYSVATGADPAMLARGVTTAAGVNALFPTASVASGVTVHMALAVTLGIALAFVWQTLSSHYPRANNPFSFMIAALVGIWAINFFLVLPIVSPTFVHMVPYSVSLMSKALFGLAAAQVFYLLADPVLDVRQVRSEGRSS